MGAGWFESRCSTKNEETGELEFLLILGLFVRKFLGVNIIVFQKVAVSIQI